MRGKAGEEGNSSLVTMMLRHQRFARESSFEEGFVGDMITFWIGNIYIRMVLVMGGKWPYSCCLVECWFFKLTRGILEQFLSNFFSKRFVSIQVVYPSSGLVWLSYMPYQPL